MTHSRPGSIVLRIKNSCDKTFFLLSWNIIIIIDSFPTTWIYYSLDVRHLIKRTVCLVSSQGWGSNSTILNHNEYRKWATQHYSDVWWITIIQNVRYWLNEVTDQVRECWMNRFNLFWQCFHVKNSPTVFDNQFTLQWLDGGC